MSSNKKGAIATGHGQDHAHDWVALSYHAGYGRQPEENQDAYWPQGRVIGPGGQVLITDYLVAGRLYIVADGVSESYDGHEASALAVKTIGESFYRLVKEKKLALGQEQFQRLLQACLVEAILAADTQLIKKSAEYSKQTGREAILQSTCVCALVHGTTLYTAHVGDSRAYRLNLQRSEAALRLTNDHVVGRDQLGRALGVGLKPHQVEWQCHPAPLTDGDIILLCSDGLYKELVDAHGRAADEQQIAYYLQHPTASLNALQQGCDNLAAAVLAQGKPASHDDLTILLLQYQAPDTANVLRTVDLGMAESKDEIKTIITTLEEVAWWSPQARYANKTILAWLGQFYEELSEKTSRSDAALSAASRETAQRLGYRSTESPEYLVIKQQWEQSPQLRLSPEAKLELLDRLLYIIDGIVDDTRWSLLMAMAEEVIRIHRATNWLRAAAYSLLVQTKLRQAHNAGRINRLEQQYHRFHDQHIDNINFWLRTYVLPYKNRNVQEWVEEIVELSPIDFVQRTADIGVAEAIERLEKVIIVAMLVWEYEAGNEEGAFEVTVKNHLLTWARARLLFLGLNLLSHRRVRRAKLLTAPYKHWPEADAIYQIAHILGNYDEYSGQFVAPVEQQQYKRCLDRLARINVSLGQRLFTERAFWANLPLQDFSQLFSAQHFQVTSDHFDLDLLQLAFANSHFAETFLQPLDHLAMSDTGDFAQLNQQQQRAIYIHRWRGFSWLPASMSVNQLIDYDQRYKKVQGRLDSSLQTILAENETAAHFADKLEKEHSQLFLFPFLEVRQLRREVEQGAAVPSANLPQPLTLPVKTQPMASSRS